MITLIIVLTLISGAACLIAVTIENCSVKDLCAIISFSFTMALGISLSSVIRTYQDTPEALDVYRGNTELVIHCEMRDSILIPTDSIVVFRNE